MKLVLFDCDGTLVDSANLIHEVMVQAFRHFELEVPDAAATRSIIGLTLEVAVARMLGLRDDDEKAARIAAHYRSIFGPIRARPGLREPLYPGIAELITLLSSQEQVILGVVTGKSRRGLNFICETHGFEHTFFVSRTADDCPSKPHPAMVTECCEISGISPSSTVVIGDSVYDMEMAKAAGAKAIGVSWGYGAAADLLNSGADAIANDAAEIPGLLDMMEAG